jgi:hypothetical protein
MVHPDSPAACREIEQWRDQGEEPRR